MCEALIFDRVHPCEGSDASVSCTLLRHTENLPTIHGGLSPREVRSAGRRHPFGLLPECFR